VKSEKSKVKGEKNRAVARGPQYHLPELRGKQRSEDRGQKTEDPSTIFRSYGASRGQRAEVRSQRTEDKGHRA